MDGSSDIASDQAATRPRQRLATVALSDADLRESALDLDDLDGLSAGDRATLKLERVKMLADHTRFYIGLYTVLAGGVVALSIGDFHWSKLLPCLPLALAGLAGGVVASNLLRFNSVVDFRTGGVGPRIAGAARWKRPGATWEALERTLFWLGVALFAVLVLTGVYARSPAAAVSGPAIAVPAAPAAQVAVPAPAPAPKKEEPPAARPADEPAGAKPAPVAAKPAAAAKPTAAKPAASVKSPAHPARAAVHPKPHAAAAKHPR
jgi:hypothetical protein